MQEQHNSIEHFPLKNKLHTDVLEDVYGPITPEVLRHDAEIREACLNDAHGICRTYALTFFSSQGMEGEIAEIDRVIREGGSIGKTFRDFGYTIRKNVVGVFPLEVTPWLKDRFQEPADFAKARLSEFYAKKEDSAPEIYGTVMEAYTPDFRSAVVNQVDLAQIGATTEALEKAGILKQEIWMRLGLENPWHDMPPIFAQAQEESLRVVTDYQQKITAYLAQNH
jgi:hypothetical protein